MMGILVAVALCAVLGALGVMYGALRASRRQATALVERITRLESLVAEFARPTAGRPSSSPAATATEFVITHLGETGTDAEVGAERTPVKVSLSGPAFADAVVRETVVQTASLVHGVRRALAPETRNRIRFEMKRDLKRSRKDRRLEMKQALREHRARQRRGTALVADEEGAA